MAVNIVPYASEYFDGLDRLWREAFPDDPPWNRAALAVPAKLAVQPELFWVAIDGASVVGSIMAGYDGHRGWLYALAVLGGRQRAGVGGALVRAAEARLAAIGCTKVNLQVRATNAQLVSFYERLGFSIEDRISLGKRL